MKVALIQEHIDPARGGAETSTLEMARHLAELGPDVTIVYSADAGTTPYVRDNVTYLPIITAGASKLLRTYRFVSGVQALCRVERFAIVHAITPCLTANVYQPRGGTYPETIRRSTALAPAAVRWLKRLGRRFNARQNFLQRVERLLLTKHRARVMVAAVSDYVRRQVVEGYDFPAERAQVVFNGVDSRPLSADESAKQRIELRGRLGLGEAQKLVLFVAHNFRLKGLRELLMALAHGGAPQAGAHLVVAGRDRTGPYEQLAARQGHVHFVGTDTPVRAWYAAADVLAHPTWYDPCSRVVLEALAAGLPVVTTHYNGAAEAMTVGRHGAVVPVPNDRAALWAALQAALQPEVRAACLADRAALAERVSMARHARELLALYETVQQDQRAARRVEHTP